MPDLLITDLDLALYDRLRNTAEAKGMSLEQAAREALTEKFRPSKEEVWAEIDRLRESIGSVSGDSTVFIRGDRDRGWRDW